MSVSAFFNARGPHPLAAASRSRAQQRPQALLNARGAPPPLAAASRSRAQQRPQALLNARGTPLPLLLAILAVGAVVFGQTGPSAQEVATSVQRKYDTIRDFSTDFVHTHEGGVLKRKREERGTLLVKKPGKMRWNYKAPDEKVFVSDGVRLTQYFPEENRALISAVPEDDQAAVLFLAGRGSLTRDFNISFGQGGAAGTWTLRLEPKRPEAEYDWLEISAARDTFLLQSLTVAEKQGQPFDLRLHELQGKPGNSR